MDVSVKSAYDKLTAVCERVESLQNKKENAIALKELLAEDIYAFICEISESGAEKRYNYFNEVYQNGAYPASDLESSITNNLPRLFCFLNEFDCTRPHKKAVQTAGLFVSFIAELGRHYLLSKFDKREVNHEKYMDYLRRLQGALSSVNNDSSSNRSDVTASLGACNASSSAIYSKGSEGTGEANEHLQKELSDEAEVPEESLEELLEKLNALIGLDGVKQEVNTLINLIKIKKIRDARGFKTASISKHLVFLGNPGTGKTTIARLLSKIYKQLGVLEKGQLVEVDRAGLVAGYVGQTALKTKEKIDEAMGGILFIDEAYTLAKGGNDFGQEAIDTILKAMEDDREKFIVIVAGYSKPMERFLQSNPGLRSRFNKVIVFEDYSSNELFSIIETFCEPYGMALNSEARSALYNYLNWLVENKPDNFANGREMRNIFEAAISNQADRLSGYTELTDSELNEIRKEDLPEYVIANKYNK